MPIVDHPKTSVSRRNGDPFEQAPLPKAFYHPSKPKDLNERERKTCLSPEHKEKDQIASEADKRFLHQSNTIHEIPTRENGIAADETSSSTQFNESWPSTERPSTVALTPETVADSTSETVKLSEAQGWPDLTQISLPDSTLARYIYRFRHSAPSSRQTRDRTYLEKGKEGEFWWLSSSPDSNSTPRQSTPLEEQVPMSKSLLSPKMKKKPLREKEAMSPSLTPLSHKLTSGPSTLASSVEGMDMPTKMLQKKAKELIDKSESTLDLTSSSSGSPLLERGMSQRTEKDHHGSREKDAKKHANFHPKKHQAPPLSPEEDILYQWRLARKMERAQEKAAQSGGVYNVASLRPVLSTSNMGLGKQPSCQITNISSHGPMSYPSAAADHKPLMTSTVTANAPSGVPLITNPTPVGLNGKNTTAVTTVTSSHPIGVPSTATPLPVHSEEISPHTNVLPCLPHGSLPRLDGTPCGAVFSAEEVVRSSPTTAPSQLSAATSTALSSSSAVTTAVLSNPVAHVGSLILHDTEHMTHLTHCHYLPKKQYSTANVPPHMHLSCDILSCPHDVQRPLEAMEIPLALPVHSHKHKETGLRGAKNETNELWKDCRVPKSRYRRAVGENEIMKTRSKIKHRQEIRMGGFHTKDSDAQRDCEPRNVSVELGDVQQRETLVEKNVKPKNARMVDNMIGQVVSERLFPSRDSSQNPEESSTTTASNLEFGSDETEILDESISDDEIIRVLQEKMQRYRKELRQIDELLSEQATR